VKVGDEDPEVINEGMLNDDLLVLNRCPFFTPSSTFDSLNMNELVYTLDRYMYYMLRLLRILTPPLRRPLLRFKLYDDGDGGMGFLYNGVLNDLILPSALFSLSYAEILDGVSQENMPNLEHLIIRHIELLRRMINARDFRCLIRFNTDVPMTIKGDFVRVLGLDPSKPHVIDQNGIEIRFPLDGFKYITISSSR
jgi:hypothetical protein